jgi:thiol:disulfide interchange protein
MVSDINYSCGVEFVGGIKAMQSIIKVRALLLALALGALAPVARAQGPGARHQIYSETADPKASIAAGLAQAKREHKRVIIDFGGDWCGDCQVLDIYFHQQPNLGLLQKSFVLVHVWVPETLDKNGDIGLKYGVPITKGVPALAVLDENGKVLYAQRTGQFNDMRHMDVGSVSEFLNRWKG